MQVRYLLWLLVKFGPFYLILHLCIPCHPLMLLSQAGFGWNELARTTCTYTTPHPRNSVLRQAQNLTKTDGRVTALLRRPPGGASPLMRMRGHLPLPGEGQQMEITSRHHSLATSVTFINTQTGCKTTDILKWTFGTMQIITKITFWGGKCLLIYFYFLFCFS